MNSWEEFVRASRGDRLCELVGLRALWSSGNVALVGLTPQVA